MFNILNIYYGYSKLFFIFYSILVKKKCFMMYFIVFLVIECKF